MSVQLVRVGDGKVAHIGIVHKNDWRPICGQEADAHFLPLQLFHGHRHLHRLCDNCQKATNRINSLAALTDLSKAGK